MEERIGFQFKGALDKAGLIVPDTPHRADAPLVAIKLRPVFEIARCRRHSSDDFAAPFLNPLAQIRLRISVWLWPIGDKGVMDASAWGENLPV